MAIARTGTFSRTLRSTYYFSIRAVEVNEADIRGLIRMSGKRKGYSTEPLTGIMVPFKARAEGLEVFSDFKFFYGDQYMLANNYNTGRPPITKAELKEAMDKEGLKKRGEEIHRYYLLPVESMGLSQGQQEVVEALVAMAEQRLPAWLGRLGRTEIKDQPQGKLPADFTQSFKYFPQSIIKAAIKSGAYYLYTCDARTSVADTFDSPVIRVLSTPMGGLPQWAKDFMRRGGKN